MIPLNQKVNVDTSDPDYPHGKSQDVSTAGPGNGTPIDFARFNDWDQLMEKIMIASGITPNGDPDNANNGYQLWDAFRKITRPYKVYQAILSQSGTTAPTPTVLLDEIGDISFTYSSVGVFTIDSSGSSFTASKTVVLNGNDGNPNESVQTSVGATNQISLFSYAQSGGTYTLTNGVMGSTFIEIRVYD